MNKLTIIAIILASLAGQNSFGQGSPRTEKLLGCWDGTFAYNMFRVEQSHSHFFVTVAGSSLTGLNNEENFYFSNGVQSISIGQQFNRTILTATFNKDQCTWDEASMSLSCEAGTDDVYNKTEALYVEKKIDHMGAVLTLVSKFPVAQINITANGEEGLTLSETRRYANGRVDVQRLKVEKYEVGGGEEVPLSCELTTGNRYLDVFAPVQLVELIQP